MIVCFVFNNVALAPPSQLAALPATPLGANVSCTLSLYAPPLLQVGALLLHLLLITEVL